VTGAPGGESRQVAMNRRADGHHDGALPFARLAELICPSRLAHGGKPSASIRAT